MRGLDGLCVDWGQGCLSSTLEVCEREVIVKT